MSVTAIVGSTNASARPAPRLLLRYSGWDGLLVTLACAHGTLLLAAPSTTIIGLGLWWNANTISHHFIHAPFFRSRALNRFFSLYLSGLLGIPQSYWRDRHLQHHAGIRRPLRLTRELLFESLIVVGIWSTLALFVPAFFAGVYLPGYAIGLVLCLLQGHFEHARGTTSHYGRLYNWCFFNDGYHVEHHDRPGEHWTRLPQRLQPGARQSRWPPVLRWLDAFNLESLERLVLGSPRLQRFVLRAHERAFRALLTKIPAIRSVTIVGGGLFPRTALILRQLLPEATLTVVDFNGAHLTIARCFLEDAVELSERSYDAAAVDSADLVVVPLSFVGDRARLYDRPPARAVLIHDWMWRARGTGVPVSWLLLKRLNLVRR